MNEKKFFAGWWLWVLLLLVISSVVIGAVNFLGLFGKTVAERVIFEQSYQKKAGDNRKSSIMNAQLIEIERQLRDTSLTPAQRRTLESRAAALRIQLSTTK